MKKVLDSNIEQGGCSVNKNIRMEISPQLSLDDGDQEFTF